jgi:hypothetical protein
MKADVAVGEVERAERKLGGDLNFGGAGGWAKRHNSPDPAASVFDY